MKKSLLLLVAGFIIAAGISAQSIDDSFFDKVSYAGAFDGMNDWTAGWAEWDPINAEYPEPTVTKGNGQFTRAAGTHITASETWSGVIKLDGWVYVDQGATLTIEPGTIIRGTERSVLSVERGAKIIAEGTPENPIVFTSAQGAGFRGPSDWAGLVLNGFAPNNLPGGEGLAEGGIGSPYGGTDPSDSSGVLAYVRIEFPGYEVATGSEVNGLTLNSVGNHTRLEYIQVSYSGDDGFEWFGGTVNAKYLISYKTEDDDFDTDNGFSGLVQFGLILRDPEIVDTDTANGFESDNDRDGSNTSPITKAIFSNISGFGAAADQATYESLPQNHREGAALRIRRNSRISVYNSLFMGWGRGLRFESSGTHSAAQSGELAVKNTFIGGIFGNKFLTDNAILSADQLEQWFLEPTNRNRVLDDMSDFMIADPFNTENPDFQPQPGSPVLNASYWTSTSAPGINKQENPFEVTSYPNPFNQLTNIRLTLSKHSPVNISIFNLAGQMIKEVYKGDLHEGIHRFDFNAAGLPKGMYYGKVLVGDNALIIKMISQ